MVSPEVRTDISPIPVVPKTPNAVISTVVPVAEGMKSVGEKPMGQESVAETPVMGVKPAVPTVPERRPMSGKGI